MDTEQITYQHSVFCQTSLPYREPRGETTEWRRDNGNVQLLITAQKVLHPITKEFVTLGIPYGTKPRLILGDIHTRAVLQQSPKIDVEKTFNAYMKRLGINDSGRNIKAMKDAFGRLCATMIHIAFANEKSIHQIQGPIVGSMRMWAPEKENRRILWPEVVCFAADYFEMLIKHAVPLDNDQYFSLQHTAMGMDIYAWLAQRLHRIHKQSDVLISWNQLLLQFGWHYKRPDNFRPEFRIALDQVLTAYRDAKVEEVPGGLLLKNSPPPVKKTLITKALSSGQ